jgi:hypothetical protein
VREGALASALTARQTARAKRSVTEPVTRARLPRLQNAIRAVRRVAMLAPCGGVSSLYCVYMRQPHKLI